VLERAVNWTGSEVPVELGKLEALCEALGDAIVTSLEAAGHPARFRRTLAGAQVTLDKRQIRVERAPPRRSGRARPASKRP
jgi:tRNA(Ile)-lysidine synthase